MGCAGTGTAYKMLTCGFTVPITMVSWVCRGMKSKIFYYFIILCIILFYYMGGKVTLVCKTLYISDLCTDHLSLFGLPAHFGIPCSHHHPHPTLTPCHCCSLLPLPPVASAFPVAGMPCCGCSLLPPLWLPPPPLPSTMGCHVTGHQCLLVRKGERGR